MIAYSAKKLKPKNSNDEIVEIENACKKGKIGCVECKKRCANNINNLLKPIRDKKASLKDDEILDIINEGNKKAKEIASAKMKEVNKVIFWVKME